MVKNWEEKQLKFEGNQTFTSQREHRKRRYFEASKKAVASGTAACTGRGMKSTKAARVQRMPCSDQVEDGRY